MWFNWIKSYYDMGFYNNTKGDPMYVGNYVAYGTITAAQFKEITGEDYVA